VKEVLDSWLWRLVERIDETVGLDKRLGETGRAVDGRRIIRKTF